MKYSILILLLSLQAFAAGETRFKSGTINYGSASVGTNVAADSKAVLDLVSTTKGFLPPRMTQTQRDAIASPTTGLVVFNSDTGKLNTYNGSAWVEVGSGSGGQGGVNFLALDSSFLPNKITNSDFETSVGDWTTYADAAGASPVDMTGGSATTTFARSTSSPLDGAGHGLLTKDAANRQGEGASCVAYIPPAYRTSRIYYEFAYKVMSGTYALDDTQVFVYDVTNSQVITPFRQSKIYGTQGVAFGYFDIQSTTAQIRFGLHVASTSASAYTLAIDDVKVTPVARSFSAPVSEWMSYTPTFTGFGTVATQSSWYRRVGDTVQIRTRFTCGTSTATEARISLPSGLTSDSSKLHGTMELVGEGSWSGDGTTASRSYKVFVQPSKTYLVFGFDGPNTIAAMNGNQLAVSGQDLDFLATVPISGWGSNVQMASSSQFKISSYLANGTRVTSQPTNFGEYRTYKKTASALTGTDDAPTAAPSTANGMRIYGVTYASAGTAGATNRWEIFVGKNKFVKPIYYLSAGRTGYIDTTFFANGSSTKGLNFNYDPVTGIAIVDAIFDGTAGSTSRYVGTGLGIGGATHTDPTDCYFDLIVSENALAVGVDSVRSEVFVTGGSGHGSTNTKIRRFTTIQKNIGSAITYADSATAGGSFTINEDGIYSISYSDYNSTVQAAVGISRNSTNLTTSVFSLSYPELIRYCSFPTTTANGPTVTLGLSAGDVIRAHTDGNANLAAGADEVNFRITKVNY